MITDNPPTANPVTAGTETEEPAKGRTRRSLGDGRVPFQAYIMPRGLRELKTLAADQDRPYTDLVAEAIDDLFAKYDRPQVARPPRG